MDTTRAWEALREMSLDPKTYKDRPSKGKLVTVVRGRKHLGKEGRVFWHGKDRFSDWGRYDFNAMVGAVREMHGIHGFRVGIETADGEKFFVPADYVKIKEEGDKC